MYTDTMKELPGYSCTELSMWEFPFLEGACRQGGNVILFKWDAPAGNPGKCAYTCILSYSIVVSHLSFNFHCLLLLQCIYLRDAAQHHGGPAGGEGQHLQPLQEQRLQLQRPIQTGHNSSLILSLSGIIFQKLLLQNLPLDSCFIFDTGICFLWGLNFYNQSHIYLKYGNLQQVSKKGRTMKYL